MPEEKPSSRLSISQQVLRSVLAGIILAVVVPTSFLFFLHIIRPVHSRIAKCEYNLMVIHNAELTWASSEGKPTNAVPTWDDLTPFLESHTADLGWTNGRPTCPQGGTYILTPVGEYPRCSIGGPDHSIPSELPPTKH